MLYLIWLAVIAAALFLFFRKQLSFFSSRGVKSMPALPLLGNMGQMLLRRRHFTDEITRFYNMYPDERFVGKFDFTVPVLILRDIELIKKVTIKDFDNFIDHLSVVKEDVDSLIGRSLLSLTGHEWKDMRSTLSPAFTSSKIRVMVPFMVEVGDQMIKTLKEKIKDSKNDYIDLDVKDLSARYANDVIASCAFGLKVNSHTDENNEFYAMGKTLTNFTFKELFKFVGFLVSPKIMKALGLSVFDENAKSFLSNQVMYTMKNREENNIVRPDMIHLLMEVRKGRLTHEDKSSKDEGAGFSTVEESSIGMKNINREWSDNDLVAQAVLFFFAGFETVSTVMSFLLYELAVNPDIQELLVQEIRENDAKNGGKFDYTSIQRMTYMDMVVSELLRLWPPAIALDRLCVQDYNCGKPNSNATKDFILPKGKSIFIPVWAFHRNPEYFPNPSKFDPERFSEENKHKINSFAYMPFGLGPRNCIGSRFALCEVKVMVYQLLQHIEVSPGEKTYIPAELDNSSINLSVKGGNWLRFKIRNTSF